VRVALVNDSPSMVAVCHKRNDLGAVHGIIGVVEDIKDVLPQDNEPSWVAPCAD
jgi:hypothetical protein